VVAERDLAECQQHQGEPVADRQRDGVVRQTGHHGLQHRVLGAGDRAAGDQGEGEDRGAEEQRRQDPDREEVARADGEGRGDADHDQDAVEEHADTVREQQLDRHHQRKGCG
jgi:hypothetical protein